MQYGELSLSRWGELKRKAEKMTSYQGCGWLAKNGVYI